MSRHQCPVTPYVLICAIVSMAFVTVAALALKGEMSLELPNAKINVGGKQPPYADMPTQLEARTEVALPASCQPNTKGMEGKRSPPSQRRSAWNTPNAPKPSRQPAGNTSNICPNR